MVKSYHSIFRLLFLLLSLLSYITYGQTTTSAPPPSTTDSDDTTDKGELYGAIAIGVFIVIIALIILADVVHKRFVRNGAHLIPNFDTDKTLIGQKRTSSKHTNTNKNNIVEVVKHEEKEEEEPKSGNEWSELEDSKELDQLIELAEVQKNIDDRTDNKDTKLTNKNIST
eukprot:155277_1